MGDTGAYGDVGMAAKHWRKGFTPASGRQSIYSDFAREPTDWRLKSRLTSAPSEFLSCVTSVGSKLRLLSGVTTNDAMTSMQSEASQADLDPFSYVSLDRPLLHIWIVDGGHLMLLSANSHGFFHEGSCYLVLTIRDDRTASLHRWYGQQRTTHDKQTVDNYSRQLDRALDHAAIFSKEVQGQESTCFLRNFPDGVIYLEGRPKTSLQRAAKYKKRLYIIRGRKFASATCTDPTQAQLDSGSAALLDGHPRMYLWMGARCDVVSRLKAIQVARKMRAWQRKGKAHIVVVEETDTERHTQLMSKLGSKAGAETAQDTNSFSTTADPHSNHTFNLHRVGGDLVMYDMPFAAANPLRQRFLVSEDCFLLDQGPRCCLFVWVGSRASNSDMCEALTRGENFASHKGYPSWLPVCRVTEGREPADWKQGFAEWREKVVESQIHARSYSVGNLGRALFSRSKLHTVAKVSPLLDPDINLSADGQTETFRVEDDSLEPPWKVQPGVFLNSDCYVIWHRPNPQTTADVLPPNVFFYWLGCKSEPGIQSSCLRLCLTMACAVDEALVIRVLDDKEPQAFLSVFHNSLVVYDHDVRASGGSEISMYCVRECAEGSMRVQQVPANSRFLNSSAAFVLLASGRCLLWFGKMTGGSEREFSKTMLGFLANERMYNYDVIMEGREPDSFWEQLGGRREYQEDFQQTTLIRRSPRLCLCSWTSGTLHFTDIPDFDQEDLSEGEVFIMDIFEQVFLWCGSKVDEESRKQLIPKCITEYMACDPAKRSEGEVQVWLVFQYSEPEAFRRFFNFWEMTGYGGEEAYCQARKRLRQENARIDVDAEQLLDVTYKKMTHYPYQALLQREMPPDVEYDHKEHHLSDKQFREALGVSRLLFYTLPEFKQAQMLRAAYLTHMDPDTRPRKPRPLTTTKSAPTLTPGATTSKRSL